MDVFWAAFGGGAAAGVVTLVSVTAIELIRWRLVEPKLRVRANWTFRLSASSEVTQWLAIQVSNIRSRPLTVSGYGFNYKNGFLSTNSVHFLDSDLPVHLLAGESHTLYIRPSRLKDGPLTDSSGSSLIRTAFVSTSDGREFRSKLKGLTIDTLAMSFSEYAPPGASDEP